MNKNPPSSRSSLPTRSIRIHTLIHCPCPPTLQALPRPRAPGHLLHPPAPTVPQHLPVLYRGHVCVCACVCACACACACFHFLNSSRYRIGYWTLPTTQSPITQIACSPPCKSQLRRPRHATPSHPHLPTHWLRRPKPLPFPLPSYPDDDDDRETRRLESIASSPVYSLLSEAMAGLPTLRSLGAVGMFQVRDGQRGVGLADEGREGGRTDGWTEGRKRSINRG
jgi:hypothetical protein